MIKKFGEIVNIKTHKICDSMSQNTCRIVILAVCSVFIALYILVLLDTSDNTQLLTEIKILPKGYGGE